MKVKLNEKIKNLRKSAKLSQEGLAEKLNVSRQTVFKWESGRATPDTHNVVLMSKLFQVPLEELLYNEVELAVASKSVSIQSVKEAQNNENPLSAQENFEECSKKRRRLLALLFINCIYILGICIYFMVVRLRWDTRWGFVLPTLIGGVFFTAATLGLYLNYKKELKYERLFGARVFYGFILGGLLCYACCIMIAGSAFLSQFPHFSPVGFFGLLLFLGIYPVQFFVPFLLIRGVIFVFPSKTKKKDDLVSSIKREAIVAVILSSCYFVGMNTFYRIKAATGVFDWVYSENLSVLWRFLDGISLASFAITALFIFPCVSLIRACGQREKYNMPLKKGRFVVLRACAMLYLAFILIVNWITFDMFYAGNFFAFTFGLTFNIILPILSVFVIFSICKKIRKKSKV